MKLETLPAMMLVSATIIFVLYVFLVRYAAASADWRRREQRRLARIAETEGGEKPPKPSVSFRMPYYPMEKKDVLPMVLITAVYLCIAMVRLGSTQAPQTFAHLTTDQPKAVVELPEETEVADLRYYTGLYSGSTYEVAYSTDGQHWTVVDQIYQRYNTLFKWHDLDGEMWEEDSEVHTPYLGFPFTARYLRFTLTEGTDVELGEIAVKAVDGTWVDGLSGTGEASKLCDEASTVPDEITEQNSTYFDEIYHPRTAYEHIRNVYPYEVSHPPLGKLIQALGILMFGMTPFGWRFMGTVLGAAMLPVLYVFLKNLFGRTPLAVCGTLLFAFDFMHFVQTRIATIDTYSVLFVLLSYYFLYRYFAQAEDTPFRRQMIPLGLCGLFFGIGAASKWTVIYAGGGLCVLYFWRFVLCLRKQGRSPQTTRWAVKTILWSVVFFVLIPAVIYTLSYLPYARASGQSVIKEMIDNQVFMFTYHNGVHQEHPYSSRWYQWIVDARPILYYSHYYDDGTKTCIASFANPVVAWGGLISVGILLHQGITRKCGTAWFLFIAWFAELAPWLIIGRTLFEYHYFGCVLFLVFAMVYGMDRVWTMNRGRGKGWCYALTAYSVGLFALFYPALSGLRVARWFCIDFLKWFPSWPVG